VFYFGSTSTTLPVSGFVTLLVEAADDFSEREEDVRDEVVSSSDFGASS
jgi:hypothetical protein